MSGTSAVALQTAWTPHAARLRPSCGAITLFGLVVAGSMELIRRWHKSNTVRHRDEVERLLAIARSDPH